MTRLAIDQLRSARVRRESYVGEWLPEPLPTNGDDRLDDPVADVEQAESLSMAFLLVLDWLVRSNGPCSCCTTLGCDYSEIAGIVGKPRSTAARSRPVFGATSRRRSRASTPRGRKRDELAGRFFRAMTQGDTPGLVELLAADVVVYGDGGGKAPQWATAVTGADRVARLFLGLGRQMREVGVTVSSRT